MRAVRVICLSAALWILPQHADALNVVLPGGSGAVGKQFASEILQHDVTILARNAFLAATPNRVSEDFGWVGSKYLSQFRHVKLRDWDGGDLLDIVGQDWMGWQDDALKSADVIIHLTGGGFTEQRVMACERLVRESLTCNPNALHITVNPTDELLPFLSAGMLTVKKERIRKCEDMVKSNCARHVCLRVDSRKVQAACDAISSAMEKECAAPTES